MFLLRIVSCFAILIFTLFSTSANADSNSGVCLLLKQQMERFADTKTHPSYRKASRDYRKQCVDKAPTQKANTQTTVTEKAPKTGVISSTETVDVLTVKPEASFDDEQTQAAQKVEQAQTEAPVEAEANTPSESESTNQTDEQTKSPDTNTVAKEPTKAQVKPKLSLPVETDFEAPKANIPWGALIAVVLLLLLLIAMRVYKDKFDQLKHKSKVIGVSLGKAAEQAKENAKAKAQRKNELDPEIYFSFHKLEVETEGSKSVIIDRVILSHFGIFVIHYQKQRGAIMGSATQAQWNEQVGQEKIPFDNPINIVNQASYAVARILSLGNEIETVVTFNDMAQFKSQLPIIVMQRKDLVKYIVGFKELKHSDDAIDDMVKQLDSYVAKQKADKLAQEQAEIERQLAEVSMRQKQMTQTPEEVPAEQADDMVENAETQYPEPGSYIESLNEVDNLPSLSAEQVKQNEDDDAKESIYHSITDQAESKFDLDSLTQQAADDLNQQPSDEVRTDEHQLPELSEPVQETASASHIEPEPTPLNNDLEFNLSSEYKAVQQEESIESSEFKPAESLAITQANELNTEYAPEDELAPQNPVTEDDDLKARFDFPDLAKEAPWLDLKNEDEANTVSHSEFKRRAAKKAAEKSGMFDYLDHYTTKNEGIESNSKESDLDFEAELAQSLAAGKGFLDDIDAALEDSKARRNELEEHHQVDDDLDAELEQSIYAKNDVYATKSYTSLDDSLTEPQSLPEEFMQSQETKLAEQELSDDNLSISSSEHQEETPLESSGSSWRKLAEQEANEDGLSISSSEHQEEAPLESSGSSWRKLAEQEANEDGLSISSSEHQEKTPLESSGSSWRKLAEQEANEDGLSISAAEHQEETPLESSGSSWRKLAEQEKQDDSEANEEKKANPFANLSLDPDWGPKETPKNTYSSLDDIDSEIPIPDSSKKPR